MGSSAPQKNQAKLPNESIPILIGNITLKPSLKFENIKNLTI